jgi:hypothetical protein
MRSYFSRPVGPGKAVSVTVQYREMEMRFWLEQAEAEIRELA